MNDTKSGSPLPDPLVQTLASPTGALRTPSGAGHGPASFAVGDFIAGRYRVVRFLAEGGMGEVYESEDRLLGEQVALKTIRPEIANDASIIERFRREIQLARRVTHPNVCRIFDVGIHRKALTEIDGGPEIDLAFLTMELLPGQTLAERLRAVRPLPREEALGLITQVAGALAAAHDAGVVHRDFKPQNVILVPPAREGGPVRAVVTDFGLARGRVPDPRGADNVTGAGGIVGSPAYMAPEQVEGGEVGPAADLYALGVVLYEMVTGVLPYVGETPLATAAKRLKGPPLVPSTHVPDIDPAWEAAILRCLERDPAARFAQVADLPAALRGERRAGEPAAARPGRGLVARYRGGSPEARQRRRGLAVALALVAGGIAAGVGMSRMSSHPPTPPKVKWMAHGPDVPDPPLPPMPVRPGGHEKHQEMSELSHVLGLPELSSVKLRALAKLVGARDAIAQLLGEDEGTCSSRTVAVIGFKNLSGDEDVAWISTALTEMMVTELAAGEKLRTVPGESVSRMKRELDLGDAESYAEDTLGRIRDNVCATHVLVGSYVAQGQGGSGPLRLDLRLQDTQTGETIAQVAENGRQEQLIELVSAAGTRLREAVGAGELSDAESAGARAALPSTSEAARRYSEGLTKLRREECRDAQDLLEQAVKADPEFALAHAALAEALWCVGYEDKGAAEAKKAFALSANLPRKERLIVQGTVWLLTGENEKALEAFQTLWEFYPNEIEFGLKLAGQQAAMKREKDFRATVAQLRKLPAPDNQHPRIDSYEAHLAQMKNDQPARRAALERAYRRADQRGAKIMSAAVLMELVPIYIEAGEIDMARNAGATILKTGRDFGDRELEAVGLDVLATLDAHAGDLKSAEKLERASLKVVREVGIQRRLPGHTIHLAWILTAAGRLDEAEAELRGLPTTVKKGSKDKELRAWSDPGVHLARLAILRGDLAGAARALASHDALLDELGLGLSSGGDSDGTPDLIGTYLRADAMLARAQLLRARGQLVEARSAIDEARELGSERRSPVFLAAVDLHFAHVLDESGAHVEAAAHAEDVARRFHGLGLKDLEAEARSVQAGALLSAGKPAEARAVLDPAIECAIETESKVTQIIVGLVDARLLAASTDSEERQRASGRLTELVTLGHQLGLGSLELEAALVLGEQDLASGQSKRMADGRARLAKVERMAKERGFGAFARRAAAAVGS